MIRKGRRRETTIPSVQKKRQKKPYDYFKKLAFNLSNLTSR